MKRLISVIAAISLFCSLLILPASASETENDDSTTYHGMMPAHTDEVAN